MSAIQRGLYVTIGAADYAAEKIGEIPAVSKFVEQSKKLSEKSVLDRARELEPKLREQTADLQKRGEKAVKRLREQGEELRKQVQNFPKDARKQLQELPATARKQVTEIRERITKPAATNGAKKPATAKATKSPTAVS
jgi:F0F1-type ATP synthase membrane subunit b/b'